MPSILQDPTYQAAAADWLGEFNVAARHMAERAALRRQELGPFASREAVQRHIARTLTDVSVLLVALNPTTARIFLEACTPEEPRRHSISPAARADQADLQEHSNRVNAWVTPAERAALERAFAPTQILAH